MILVLTSKLCITENYNISDLSHVSVHDELELDCGRSHGELDCMVDSNGWWECLCDNEDGCNALLEGPSELIFELVRKCSLLFP